MLTKLSYDFRMVNPVLSSRKDLRMACSSSVEALLVPNFPGASSDSRSHWKTDWNESSDGKESSILLKPAGIEAGVPALVRER